MTECLDEESILSFCRGSMAIEKRPPAEAHIAECEECRVLVSAVMRSSLVDPSERIPSSRPSTEVGSSTTRDVAMDPTTPLEPAGFGAGRGSGRPAPAAPVQLGEILAGKYAVERVLGAGGMGVVVAARHTQLDQRFALKFLLPAAYEAPGAVARFIREGKAAAQITSEHVARVVDTGVLDSGAPYLVMEYLEGLDLGELVTKGGPLEPSEAVEYVLQASEAIVEAHELGIVHRDLKPANLFLTRRKDGSPLVKVLDFGISKADGGSKSQLTSTSTLMGSPRYMSPEQMVSARDVDARTDIWALGVILHELVSGQPVWHADTVQGLCALIATAPAPPLRQVAPGASKVLEDAVLRCLEKAPKDRLPSVADLALALEPIAPERARTSVERILGVARRKRVDAGSASARPLVVASPRPPVSSPPSATAAQGTLLVSVAPSTTKTSAQPAPRGHRTWVVLAAVLAALAGLGALALNVVVPRRTTERTATASGPPSASPATIAAVSATPSTAATSSASASASAAPSAAASTSASAPTSVVKASSPRGRPLDRPTRAEPHPSSADAPNRALSERK